MRRYRYSSILMQVVRYRYALVTSWNDEISGTGKGTIIDLADRFFKNTNK